MAAPKIKDIQYKSLPTLKLFHESPAHIKGVRGPVGSGKTVGCCWEIFRLAAYQQPYDNVRYTKFAMIRNTYQELLQTTLETWEQWFGDYCHIRRTAPIEARMRIPSPYDDTEIDLWLLFLALDIPSDVKKVKSLEVTGAFINEASECGRWVLTKAFERRGRYPNLPNCGPSWAGVIMDTNSCDDDHWWYKASEEEKNQGWEFFDQPPALLKFPDTKKKTAQERLNEFLLGNPNFPYELKQKVVRDFQGNLYIANPKAENVHNLPLSYNYWLDQVPGKPLDEITVFILNEYGTVTDSKPVYPEYIDSVHCAEKDLEPIKNIGITLGFDFGRCYSDDTEVLTYIDGWKFFKDVDEKKDLVATRNPENGKFEYTHINFKTAYDYKGDMYEWANLNIDFCVTPEHMIPFTYRETSEKVHFKSANWLLGNSGGHHYVDVMSKWAPRYKKKKVLGFSPIIFARFMGLYLSEGSFGKDCNRISIFQSRKSKYFNYFKKILAKTGIDWKQGGICWRASSVKLKNYLKKFGHANEKYIPKEIKEMPKKFLKAFIYSYTFGDGHIRKRKRYVKNNKKFGGGIEHTIFTSSIRMAGDLQEIAQKIGWNSSLRKVKPQKSVIIENGVKREIKNNGGYSITFKKKAKRAELLMKNFKRIKYDGKIYCLNVPYHTLYIRRNGKPSWNGNTPACTLSQISAKGQKRVIEEMLVEEHGSMGIRTFSRTVVVPFLLENYLQWLIDGIVKAYGDPSGRNREQTDEKTCFMLLNECPVNQPKGGFPDYKKCTERLKNPAWVKQLIEKAKKGEVSLGDLGVKSSPARTNSFEARRDAVGNLLTSFIDNEPALLISPKLRYLRKGMRGKYAYKRIQVSGAARYKDEPDKNIWSHINEGFQYDCLESSFLAVDPAKKAKEEEDKQRKEIGASSCAAWDELKDIMGAVSEGRYDEYYEENYLQ